MSAAGADFVDVGSESTRPGRTRSTAIEARGRRLPGHAFTRAGALIDAIDHDVLVIDHYDSYTWNLVHLVAGVTGVVPAVVQHDRVTPSDIDRFEFVILSPGPGTPDEPGDFCVGRDLLLHGTARVLGVCLGMQGIVTTFGGTVSPDGPVHGGVSRISHDGRGVFAGIPQDFDAVRYHSLTARLIPDCLEVTATTGTTVMGVRHRDLPIEGVQFHPESILTRHGSHLISNFLRA